MKTLSKAVAMASLLSAGVMGAQVANAEVEYNAGLATTYLYRGTDLGGTMFSAGADYYHESGAYAGIWAAGGDLEWGNEYDLYVGFAKELGDFSVDVMAATYTYNRHVNEDTDADELGSPGELSEAVVSLGFMDASASYTTSLISGSPSYITLGYAVAGADIMVGVSDDDAGQEYTHLDVSYGLTDQLSITVSKIVDQSLSAAAEADGGEELDDDVLVVMSYSLPL